MTAWDAALASVPRVDKNHDEYAAIGVDGRGRMVEMVTKRGPDGSRLIYHGKTPPTKKMKDELGKAWRK